MILKAVNNKVKEYGYPERFEYNNANFHGHQRGICIGIIDNKTGEIKQNYLGENYADKLQQLIDDKEILKVEDNINQFEDNELKSRTVLFLPYYVTEHSVYKPTINYDNVSAASNSVHHVEIEVLLVHQGLNRYFTIKTDTVNVSVFDIVNDFFEIDLPDFPDEEYDEDLLPGLEFKDGDEGKGWYLDFYDEAGQEYSIYFTKINSLKEAIVSFRLIDITTEIIKDGERN